MGFFADGRDEDLEEQEARELDGQFITTSAASRAYMRFTRLFPKFITWFLLACIIITYVLVTFRIQTGKAPKQMRDFVWDAQTVSTYAQFPQTFSIYSQKQEANIHSVKVNSDFSFTFQTSYIQYAPLSGQMQFVIRYNKSMEKVLNAYYKRPLDTPIAGELFVFALKDQDGTLYTDSRLILGLERNVNLFRQVSFSGLYFEADTEYTLLVCDRRNPDFSNPLLEMSVFRAVMPSEQEKVVCPDGIVAYLAQ